MRRFVSVMFVALVMACGVGGVHEADDVATTRQALDAVTGFGSNPGNLLMYRFVPTGLARGRPLVVLLHGCGETATSFSTSSGFEAQATQRQFALVLPQQQFLNNVQTCFNWFEAGNQRRDSDELLSIKQMVDRMVTDVGSDPQQVFIAGFSAGAAQVTNLLATSPDRFRAGAIAAGISFKCTETVFGASSCLSGGSPSNTDGGTRTTAERAEDVRRAFPTFTGLYPRVAVWQGASDLFVSPPSAAALVNQWTAVHGIDQTADGTQPITSGGTRTFFRASAGSVALVELNEVPGLGHAWRSAWATDVADFFGLSAATAMDGGTAGGSAGGGAAGGGTAGGAVTGGGVAGGGSASAGGVASGGGTGGGNTAGGSATAGGSGTSGGSASAGGSAAAGGAAGGGATVQPMGCQSCNSAGGSLSLALVLLLRRRVRRGARAITVDRHTPAP
ncbi:MAG: PHB depolymerase family esterase [Myxococcales bacterium]|nr:PHB depolymerase family esterase [Myxococcales bacterium]